MAASQRSPKSTARYPCRRLRVGASLLLAFVLASAFAAIAPRSVEAAGGFDPRLPRVGVINYTDCRPACGHPDAAAFSTSQAPGTLHVDSARRRLYAYWHSGFAGMPRGIAVVDVDRLVQTAWIDLRGCKLPKVPPETPSQCAGPGAGSKDFGVVAFDDVGRRLFLGETASYLGCRGTGDTPNASCGEPSRLAVVDLATSDPTPVIVKLPDAASTAAGASSSLSGGGQTPPELSVGDGVAGLAYDGERQRLYVLTVSTQSLNNKGSLVDAKGVAIVAYDAGSLGAGSQPLWTYRARACRQPLSQRRAGAYFDVGEDGSFVYVACQGSAAAATALHGVLRVNLTDAGGADDPTASFSTEFFPFAGNLSRGYSLGDPVNDRIGIGVAGVGLQRLYVFDARHRSWVGSMVLPGLNHGGGGVDTATGRIYVLNDNFGLRSVDAAALPAILGEAISLDHEAALRDVAIDPVTRRIFLPGPTFSSLPQGNQHDNAHLWVFEDRTPRYAPPPTPHPDDNTHDIPESDAAQVSHSGSGSAYGVRARVIGGLAAIPGMDGVITNIPDEFEALRPEGGDRGFFLGQIPRAQLTGEADHGQAAATAVGWRIDEATDADLRGKYGQVPLPGPGEGEDQTCDPAAPGAGCLTFDSLASNVAPLHESGCSDLGGDDDPKDASQYGSRVTCRGLDSVGAWASGSAQEPPGETEVSFDVGYSEARVDVVKDPTGGIRTKSAAVARGVTLEVAGMGALRIGEIRSVARSRAAGLLDSASSTLDAVAKNVELVDAAGERLFSCGVPDADKEEDECDPADVASAVNRHFSPRVQARSPRRDLDPLLVGSPGGAQAIVIKDRHAFWSDLNVNGDGQREVTGLDITIYNDDVEASRMTLELAGVFSEAQYQIGVPQPPELIESTKLSIGLIDDSGEPLEGGVFQVRESDSLGLPGQLVAACVTGDDGVGDCEFDNIAPGEYVISETAAPAGYAPADDATISLLGGVHTEVVFTNLRAVGRIGISLTDDGGDTGTPSPLPGATFAVLADDGDLVRGEGDQPYAECTTDAAGECAFADVPLGAYVVYQKSTPDGYLLADDVGFELEFPGQAAELSFVAGLEGIAGTPDDGGSAAEDTSGEADTSGADETTTVIIEEPPLRPAAQVSTSPLDRPSGLRRVIGLPGEVAGFLLRQPVQAVLFGLVWLLLGAPVYLAVRRRALTMAKEVV